MIPSKITVPRFYASRKYYISFLRFCKSADSSYVAFSIKIQSLPTLVKSISKKTKKIASLYIITIDAK